MVELCRPLSCLSRLIVATAAHPAAMLMSTTGGQRPFVLEITVEDWGPNPSQVLETTQSAGKSRGFAIILSTMVALKNGNLDGSSFRQRRQ